MANKDRRSKGSCYGDPNPQDGDTKAKSVKRAWMRRKDNETKSLLPKKSSQVEMNFRPSLERSKPSQVEPKHKIPSRQRRRPQFLTYNSFHTKVDRTFDIQLGLLSWVDVAAERKKKLELLASTSPPVSVPPDLGFAGGMAQTSPIPDKISSPRVSRKRPLDKGKAQASHSDLKKVRPPLRVSLEEASEEHTQEGSKVSTLVSMGGGGLLPSSPSLSLGQDGRSFRQRRTDLEKPLPVIFLREGEELTGLIAAKICGEEVLPEDLAFVPAPEPCAWPYESLELDTKESEMEITKVPQYWLLPPGALSNPVPMKSFKMPRERIQWQGSSDPEYGYDADYQDMQFLSELTSNYSSRNKATVKKLRNGSERSSNSQVDLIPVHMWEIILEALETECDASKLSYLNRRDITHQEQALQKLINDGEDTASSGSTWDGNILEPEKSLVMPTPPYLVHSRMVKMIYSILEQQVWTSKKKKPEGAWDLCEDLYIYWLQRWHSYHSPKGGGGTRESEVGPGPGGGGAMREGGGEIRLQPAPLPLRRQHTFSLLAWEPPKPEREILPLPTSTPDLQQAYDWLYRVRIELDWARMILDLAHRREKRKRELAKVTENQVQSMLATLPHS